MARAGGVGGVLATDEVRATLFGRLVGIARGASGLSPAFAAVIRDMLDKGFHPRARRIGTLGEADLSPLAQLFLPLVGQGETKFEGRVMPGREALGKAGIEPPVLGPKDAIALLNANAFSVGTGALALHDATLALQAQTAAGALSLEAPARTSRHRSARGRPAAARAGRRVTTAAVASQGGGL
jgi:histidine ammonia-lyase